MSLFKGELISLMRGLCHTSMIRLPIVIGVQLSHLKTSDVLARWGSVETCSFWDGSVGTVLLGWEPVGTCN